MIRTLRRDIARYNKEDEMVGIAVVVYFAVNSQNLYISFLAGIYNWSLSKSNIG